MSQPRNAVQEMTNKVFPVLEQCAGATDAAGAWPTRSIQALRDSGLLGLTLPKEVGGQGAGMADFVKVTEKIALRCGSTAMIYLMHVCGAQVIAASPSPKKSDLMKQMAAGKALATLAFSESGSRSHFWAPVSKAARNSTSTVLNCEKSFVTSAGQADYYVVSSGAINGKSPVHSTLYLVEKGAPGITYGNWNGMGLRGNASGPMTIAGCHVDDASRLTAEGEGFKALMDTVLPWFQIGNAAVSIGIADAAATAAATHAANTHFEHLGQSIAESLPGVRARLARMRIAVDSARAYLNQTVDKISSGAPDVMLFVLGSKALAAETALNVTDEAMRACGGAAFNRSLSVERNFRDARAASIMAPTTDVLYDFIGKAVTGLPLF